MNNYYISISNGLLDDDHQKKMGSAVWQFMWCIDKVTKIDDDGIGWVLGGKPIQLKEFKGVHKNTASRNLNKLEEKGYLKLIHTPYGISIRVMKARKRFYKNGDTQKERITESGEPKRITHNGEPRPIFGEPNKIVTVDKVAKTSAAVKTTAVVEEEYNYEKELSKLSSSSQKHLKVIALFWSRKKYKFNNKQQFQTALKRNLRTASALTGYSGAELDEIMRYCDDKLGSKGMDWGLEAVLSRAPDVINKKNADSNKVSRKVENGNEE